MSERSANGGSTWSTIASNSGSTATTYSDTGLAAGTAYTYRVSAINSVGTGSPSNSASATTLAVAPSPPMGLAATAVSSSQINLSWTAPNNGGSAITGYKIERSADGGSTWSTLVANTGITGTTYSDTGLARTTTYTYRVSAINSVGTSSPSNTASATTSVVSSPPSGLAATAASSSQINLSWAAPADNGGSAITGYKIESSTNSGSTWSVLVSNTGSTGTAYSDTGLSPSTTYSYRVSAINSVGTSTPSNTASATTQSATTSGNTTTSSIVLNGIQSTSGTVSSAPYQITLSNFNAGTGNNRLLVVGVEANNSPVTSVTFGGVQLTSAVSSFYNNDVEFWYLTNPSGTGNIVVTMTGSTSVVVGAYSISGVNQTTPIPTSITNHNTASSSPTISITTKYPNSLVLDSPSIYGGISLSSPTCTQSWNINMPSVITGASSSTVRASASSVTCRWTTSGGGDLWDDVAIEVKASGSGVNTTTNTATAPQPPTGLTATAASSSQISFSWAAPTNNGGSAITGYKIYRSTSSGTETGYVNLGNVTSYTNTIVTPGVTYFYKVRAVNSVGLSPLSNEASATPPTLPSAPQNLQATTGVGNVALTWDAPSSNSGSPITGYKIYRSTSSGTETGYVNLGNVTSYTNTGVTPGVTYFYKVRAVNSVGLSPLSNEASATP